MPDTPRPSLYPTPTIITPLNTIKNNNIFTPPSNTNTNNDYIVSVLWNDPSLNSIFTLENYNKTWNKSSLIITIKEILKNGTDDTPPLKQFESTPIPGTIYTDSSYNIPFFPSKKNKYKKKNSLIITDISNESHNLESSYGNINLELDKTFIKPNSEIKFDYTFPRNSQSKESIKTIKRSDGKNVTLNDGNTKCVYSNICRKKHFYRPNCGVNFIDDGDGNGIRCACNCSAGYVFNYNGDPHTHCSTEDFSNNIINSFNKIKSISINIPVPSDIPLPTNASGTTIYIPNIDYLTELIADYYILLLYNKDKQKTYDETKRESKNINDSKRQLYEDSNILYKGEYIKVVNISVGIFIGSLMLYSLLL